MYLKIKELADAAIALQNKIQMEVALREISAICAADDATTDAEPVEVATAARAKKGGAK